MSRSTPTSSLALALGLCLLLPLGAAAQSGATDEVVPLPELEGLAWYRSIDLSGEDMQATLSEEEIAEWSVMVDATGATFDQLEYTYQTAFDPTTLPGLGDLATIRITGADTDELRAAVVADITAQMVGLGEETPASVASSIADKDVVIVSLPESVTPEDAIVYAEGDVAYVLVMEEDLAALALAQLP
jgi:hypothetical protein